MKIFINRELLQAVVSVPIRGLFNLTEAEKRAERLESMLFPSPSGDYLI